MSAIWVAVLAALATFPTAHSHSWGEQLRNIDAEGNYVGAYGYPRGMVDRGQISPDGKDTDNAMTWRMPESNTEGKIFIDAEQLLCAPAQREQKQSSDKFPRLKAAPGGFIAIRYQENGHVTLPQNNPEKPKNGGTVYVYGTKEPKTDEKLFDVLQWTQDGKGGDKRGVLLAMNDYDDGRCYLNNDTPIAQARKAADPAYMMNTPKEGPANSVMYCETDVKLPDTVELNQAYTLYWVWQWTSLPGKTPGLKKGKDEYYSTCIDVDIASPKVAMKALDVTDLSAFAMGQQDAVPNAVKNWKSRTAHFNKLPLKREMGPVTSLLSGGGGFGGDIPTATPTAPLFSNSTGTAIPTAPAPAIPTLSGLPGVAPPPSQPDNGGVVVVTTTVMVTVTAPAATPTNAPGVGPSVARSIYHKNGAKFRGLLTT